MIRSVHSFSRVTLSHHATLDSQTNTPFVAHTIFLDFPFRGFKSSIKGERVQTDRSIRFQGLLDI